MQTASARKNAPAKNAAIACGLRSSLTGQRRTKKAGKAKTIKHKREYSTTATTRNQKGIRKAPPNIREAVTSVMQNERKPMTIVTPRESKGSLLEVKKIKIKNGRGKKQKRREGNRFIYKKARPSEKRWPIPRAHTNFTPPIELDQ